MANCLKNPYRKSGFLQDVARPVDDSATVAALLSKCPRHAETPLIEAPDIAKICGVGSLFIKDERDRMGLGSFKALGAAFVIARDAARLAADGNPTETTLVGRTYVAASAGNHGLSVAAGAALFGARAAIYLASSVPEAFADRLRAKGADVVRAGSIYEESMEAAQAAADQNGWILLSDSSWPGYTDQPLGVMEGYLQLSQEAIRQMPKTPDVVMLQAGVGGLAAAVAAHVRAVWGDDPRIIVVEPEAAPALTQSIREGALTTTGGPVSNMGRLDCKTPSMVALGSLSRDADYFVTITESEAQEGVAVLSELGFPTTPSGGAGIVALMSDLDVVGGSDCVLAILSEGVEDI